MAHCPSSLVPRVQWVCHVELNQLHLCQHCLHLRQPEGHRHGLVEVARRARLCARLRPLVTFGIERAQATTTVGLERAHTEILGQGEAQTVVEGGTGAFYPSNSSSSALASWRSAVSKPSVNQP